uniref:NADH-ubiquinone oxidoreductase chain 3 n=1 Tax=Tetragnatha nitens TaxID=545214 RepID=A0A0N7BLT1_9ARAC|nr:NADH dehydrogenase subunit 3 [Tetragnatha nitens]AKG65086.1 NADH dehydrogenase subunit 3 [Tetragnatha nitens]
MVFSISMTLMLVIYLLFYLMSFSKNNDIEKVSVYECGFDSSSLSRVMFSYRFFLISILFLVFDVEVVLLIPFTFFIGGNNEMLFIFILMVGLVYELMYGSLDWL